MKERVERIARRLALTPAMAVAVAAILLLAAFSLAIYNERVGKAESVRQASVQAQILARSVAAPLAFDDRTAADEYVDALRANPSVQAVGAYDSQGRLAAGFGRDEAAPPPRNTLRPPAIRGSKLVVTAPVLQGTTQLGTVYLQVSTEPFLRRSTRYLGIGIIVLMGSLLIAVLGAAHASLRDAHRKLQQEIAERERAEEALRQSQKMEAMGQLTGGVAHDFNNLLMVASSGLDLMERTSDPVRRERLKQGIRQAIDRGASLTQQLLAFSRRAPMKSELVDPAARLIGMHGLLDRSLHENVTVRILPAADVWPVEVDPSQLEVAVLNMALNARDAMPDGGEITIEVENAPGGPDGTGDRVRIAVSDTGVGIAPDVLPRIFEPFFTTKGVGQGTGLGLSQVYGFARASGGEVRAESQAGAGTTLTILLPRSEKALPCAPPVESKTTRAGASPRRHVLLVEDDDNVAELVGQMLAELGYEVTRAPTAATALEALRREPTFDVVFSDMVMPGEMNGLDLAREITRERPDLPVVLTTGYSASAAAAAADGLRLILKPYRLEALGAELEAALTARRSATKLH